MDQLKRLFGTEETAIDHDEPLGDATEIYNQKIIAEGDTGVEGPNFRTDLEYVEDGELFVDEIWNGQVAFLAQLERNDVRASTLFQLSPEDAKSLASILWRSAEYAEHQRESE